MPGPAHREAGHELTGVDVLQVAPHGRSAVRAGLPAVARSRVALTATGDLLLACEGLRAHRLPDVADRTRVALVVPQRPAGADDRDGRIEVDVAAGRSLEIVEVAGTGAHAVRRARTQWALDVRLGVGAVLVWPTLPIVVAPHADVLRLTHVELGAGARVVLRETLLLEHAGVPTGRVRSTFRARLDDRPLLAETFVVEPGVPLAGALHAVLDPRSAGAGRPLVPTQTDRRLDALLVLGARLDHPAALQLDGAGSVLRGPAARDHDGALADLVTRGAGRPGTAPGAGPL